VTIRQWCPITRSAEVLGDRWCLLVLRELASGPQRFKTLKKNIAGISMDQLTRKLDHLCRIFIIVRQEFSEAPPRVEYQLTDKGRSLMPVLRRIFLWGSQEAWGKNEKDEIVDVALTLRLIATFMGQGEGAVLVKILRAGSFWVQRTGDGTVRVFEKSEIEGLVSEAQLEIGLTDWIKLISRRDLTPLAVVGRIEGNRRVLEGLLPLFRGVVLKAVASPEFPVRISEVTV
jgi:DNA-binding HxlR family transcriptional regulator